MAVLPETNKGAGIHQNSFVFYDDFTRVLPAANSMGAPQRDQYGVGWNANKHGNGNPPIFTAGGGIARFISQAPPSTLNDPCGVFPQYSQVGNGIIAPVYFRLTMAMSVVVGDSGCFFSQYYDPIATNFYSSMMLTPDSASGNWIVRATSGPNPLITLLDTGIVAANGDVVQVIRTPTGIVVPDPLQGLGFGPSFTTSQIAIVVNNVAAGSFLTNIPPAFDAVQNASYGIGYLSGKQATATTARWTLFSVE